MKLLKIIILLTILSLLAYGGEHKEWYSYDEGIELANAEGKHIIIDFYTDWCHWCKVMDEKTFSVPEIETFLFKHFIPIRINADKNPKITATFKITGYPSLAFLTPNNEVLGVIPGFIQHEQFLQILEYIQKECYKKDVTLENYIISGCK